MESKIAIGVITNYVDRLSPYLDFLDNARKYGHSVNDMIIAYSHDVNKLITDRINQEVNLHLVKLTSDPEFVKTLKNIGLTESDIDVLFYSENFEKYGMIPYGKRRNCVLMKALLLYPDIEYLMFIDTDVKPYLLVNKYGKKQEIDFAGRHLKYLQKRDVLVTTSDYSGYYIIPPMEFKGLKELLIGLQKEDAYNSVCNLDKNLTTGSIDDICIQNTDKILGGNHGLDLNEYSYLPPYFSTTYKFNGELVLGRGEDTLMGREIPISNKFIVDIDTPIFHDTFANFPRQPDIAKHNIQERFYYACLGWLGRNPFLNWYLKENDFITGSESEYRRKVQKEAIKIGSNRLASYLDEEKFALLPQAYSQAYNQLQLMIEDYRKTCTAWNKFLKILQERRNKNENFAGQSLST